MKMSDYDDIRNDAREEEYYEQRREEAYRLMRQTPENYEPWMEEYLEEE
jgi:hypothetical protein